MKRIKVCGINNLLNSAEIDEINPDYMGFIFYNKSTRSLDKGDLRVQDFAKLKARKVGVFVNQSLDEVSQAIEDYGLDYVQLHGTEDVDFCWEVKSLGVGIIKAISVNDELPLSHMKKYEQVIDCFLFDTSGANHGGNGIKFDWNILKEYSLSTPFFLSGGISPGDELALKELNMEQLIGYDINSRFELSPGIKDRKAVKEFIDSIRN